MFRITSLFQLLAAVSYRSSMRVRELMVFDFLSPEDAYYVCPRCGITMEREFMNYCDRCGQCLDWTHYLQTTIVHPNIKRSRD